MQIIEVKTKQHIKAFHQVSFGIYKNDPHWICPLISMVENIFDPSVNKFFQHGEATRFLLERDGTYIGRVAAFINRKKAFTFQIPTGGMGFFECPDDMDAAFMLFDACKNWLEVREMKAMDGPINFGENDNFWGLLVEGFTEPGFGMNYHPPYYQNLFETYGFNTYFEQETQHLDRTKPFPERFWNIARWLISKPGFEYKHLDKKKLPEFLADFKVVYDDAWKFHENFTPIEPGVILNAFNESKAIIDENLIWFAYYEGKPIGFIVMFPDVNQLIKGFGGKLNWLNKIRMMYRLKIKKIHRSRIVILGVSPQYQRYGIESGLFWFLDKEMLKRLWYKEVEISWVGDFNPKMKALLYNIGAKRAKIHHTMRMVFDKDQKFVRASEIPVNTRD
ncbi:MAG: hypothetical protein Q7J34_05070 [Bacteroidales bacterium]|nr:hypothetical protein [Bacteroidales bacterium]